MAYNQSLPRRLAHNYLALWSNSPAGTDPSDHAIAEKRRWCCATLVAFAVALVFNVVATSVMIVRVNGLARDRNAVVEARRAVANEVGGRRLSRTSLPVRRGRNWFY